MDYGICVYWCSEGVFAVKKFEASQRISPHANSEQRSISESTVAEAVKSQLDRFTMDARCDLISMIEELLTKCYYLSPDRAPDAIDVIERAQRIVIEHKQRQVI